MTDKVEQRKTEMVDAAESLGISQEEYDKIVDECIFGKEEPVSECLEKAATKYAQDKYMPVQTSQAFKAGAKWQREKGESTTEDLGEYINKLSKQFPEVSFAKLSRIAVRVAKWQKEKEYTCYEEAFEDGVKWKKEQIEEVLLSEVLPCFMRGGEADEVVAKLDEVLNQKK